MFSLCIFYCMKSELIKRSSLFLSFTNESDFQSRQCSRGRKHFLREKKTVFLPTERFTVAGFISYVEGSAHFRTFLFVLTTNCYSAPAVIKVRYKNWASSAVDGAENPVIVNLESTIIFFSAFVDMLRTWTAIGQILRLLFHPLFLVKKYR